MSINHLWDSILQFLGIGDESFSLEKMIDELNSKVTSYGGEIVSLRRTLICDLVLPAWPKLGEACVIPVEDFIIPELRDDLLESYRRLFPEDEWPKSATEKQGARLRSGVVCISQGGGRA